MTCGCRVDQAGVVHVCEQHDARASMPPDIHREISWSLDDELHEVVMAAARQRVVAPIR